jgi:hypothetical protein
MLFEWASAPSCNRDLKLKFAEAANGAEAVEKAVELKHFSAWYSDASHERIPSRHRVTLEITGNTDPVLFLTQNQRMIEEAKRLGIRGLVSKGDGVNTPLKDALVLKKDSFFPNSPESCLPSFKLVHGGQAMQTGLSSTLVGEVQAQAFPDRR